MCGTCASQNKVWYPLVGSSSVVPPNEKRIDCTEWSKCGNVYETTPYTAVDSFLDDPDNAGQKYAKIFSFDPSNQNMQAPPLGYILMDSATYGIRDRIAIYINNQHIETVSTFRSTSQAANQDEYLFPPLINSNVNTNLNNVRQFSFSCNGLTNGSNFGFCTNPSYPQNEAVCACQIRCTDPTEPPCVESYGAVTPSVTGGTEPADCLSISEVSTPRILIDTGCHATTEGCPTVCYGVPKKPLQTDNSDYILPYHCRDVGKVPINFISSTYFPEFGPLDNNFPFSGYQAGFKFTDFSVINEAGCDVTQCPEDNPCPCRSAWKIRIFLPFYLNIPSVRYGSNGNPFDSQTDIRGKYVVITKNDLDLRIAASYPTAYNSHPLLKNLYDLLKGFIRSSGLTFAIPYDIITSSMSNNIMLWSMREIPRQINNSTPSHTHQVVLELTTSTDRCALCVNPNGDAGRLYDISAIRLYPITDENGIIRDNPLRLMTDLDGHNGGIGIRDLNSVMYYYHPNIGGPGGGSTYISSQTTVFNAGQYIPADNTTCLYTDTMTATTIETVGNQVSVPWSANELLNRWNQLIFNNPQTIDCNCSPL